MKRPYLALLVSSLLLVQSQSVQAQSFGQLKNAAIEAQTAKKYAEAQEFWIKALDSCTDKSGPRYMQSLSGLASCYAEQEKYAEADEWYKKFLELCKTESLSEESKTALLAYAKVLRKQNRESDAAALETKYTLNAAPVAAAPVATVPAKPKENEGEADIKQAQTLLGKANSELGARQYKQAEQSFKQALQLAEKRSDKRMISQILGGLAQVYLAQNNLAGAEPVLRKYVELARQISGDLSREHARALDTHADLLRKINRKPEAMAAEAKAENILSKIQLSSSGGSGASAGAGSGNATGTRSGSLYSRANAAQGINSGSRGQVPED